VSGAPRILALFGGAVVYGQERGNMEALCALRDQGCEVLCLVRDEAWSELVPPALDAVGLKWRKVAYIEQRMPGRMLWLLFRNPWAFMRANWVFLRIAREFRPTHVHGFNSLFVLNFLPALMLTRIPIVYRAGDRPLLHNWLWRLVWRLIVRQTVRFVANSRFTAGELVASGVAAHDIALIYSFPPRRGTPATPFRPPEGFDDAGPRFAYVGQITPEKGADVLIEAFRTIAAEAVGARLFVAGRISDWWGDAWARTLRDRTLADPALGDRVAFLGYVEDVPGLLDYCHVHVCPSVWDEPLANVVMEAKLAARPSIVFPSGGLPEIVSHGVDGFVCPDKSAHALAAALRAYLDCPEMIGRQGAAARESLERLGVMRFREAWAAVYGAVT
jgi:glycosyltransferase involved in cell wall biosynthesis